jgi:DNA-binding NarL/FixJ family response regulator
MQTRLVIVDDDEVVRASVREALWEPRDRTVVEFTDGASALAELPHLQPEAVVLDIRMPRMDGLECLHRVRPLLPVTRVILYTALGWGEVAQPAVTGRANGFVRKGRNSLELLRRTLQHATPEDLLLPHDSALTGGLSPISAELGSGAPPPSLSPREPQIVELLARGHTNKEIAGRVGLALQSFYNLLHRLRQRWHCHNSTELVARTRHAEPGADPRQPDPEK